MHEKKGPNGFLLGLLIGGAVGALVSTKKGRKILKDIADYGLDYVGNTLNLDDIETMLNNDEEEEATRGEMDAEEKTDKTTNSQSDAVSRRRRLFKGIRKSS